MSLKNQIKTLNKHVITILLFSLDSFAILCAFLLSYYLRDKGIFRAFLDSVQPIEVYLYVLPVAILLLIIVFATNGLYEAKQRITQFSESYNIFRGITMWILLLMAGSYLAKIDYSRIIVLLLYIFSLFITIFGRFIARILHAQLTKYGFATFRILIVGAGKPGKSIARRLEQYASVGFEIVGFIDDHTSSKVGTVGSLKDIHKIVKKYNVDEVYVADPMLSHEQILRLVAKNPNKSTTFKITSNIFGLLTGNVDIANLEYIPSLDVSRSDFPFWKRVYKRAFDVLLSSILLTASFPISILIVVFIKLDSKGKAILQQERIGQGGKKFIMYKFRTMTSQTKLYKLGPKNPQDQRITRVGKWLRRTSLDELPQLINVLKGDMSIVGPRPEMPFVVKKYNMWQRRRLAVKPGLTGLWQILGRKDIPLHEHLEYDFYYINNHSIILDLVIIFKTIPIVLLGKGAY